MPKPITLNAEQLRILVEAAASLRGPKGDPYFVVYDGEQLSIRHGKPGEAPPEGTVLEVDTFDQQPARPTVYDVTMTVNGPDSSPKSRTAFDLSQYDAVFWSEAAVEKFVLPYYASKSMWDAAHVLTCISELWYGFVPGADPADDARTGVQPDAIPFALAHIPSSDYVGLREDAAELVHNLHLLFRTSDGAVLPRPLSELMREREAASRGTAGPAPHTPAATDGA